MKKRLLSAAGGLVVLAVALFVYDTLWLNAMVCAAAALAVWELLHADGMTKHLPIVADCLAVCALVMFGGVSYIGRWYSVVAYACALLVLAYGLVKHREISFKDCFYAIMATIFVAAAFHIFILIRDRAGAQIGVFYLLFTLGSAWWSDAGAYFVGTFFGRHKLCPEISPKKTVEGMIGGLVSAELFNLLVCAAFQAVCAAAAPWGYLTAPVTVNFALAAVVTPLLSAVSVLGDLVASLIKRQCGVKDFGNIMPGHGGVMDRFDSVLIITPAVYLIFELLPLISAA